MNKRFDNIIFHCALFGLITAATYVLLAILIPKTRLLLGIALSSDISIQDFTKITIAVIGAWYETSTFAARVLLFTGATLAGIQGGLMTYWFLRQKSLIGAGKSSVGMFLGTITAGCASCGSFILGSLVGLGTSNLILSYLPYEGLEFGILGLGILLGTVIITFKKIRLLIKCESF